MTPAAAAAQLLMEPTFFEYMQGGVEISCSVAIDFTASNGDPTMPQSLHYYLKPFRPQSLRDGHRGGG